MFRFGVWCQWIAHTGYWLAIYQYIGGAGEYRCGREALVVRAQVSEKHYWFAHTASFALFSSVIAHYSNCCMVSYSRSILACESSLRNAAIFLPTSGTSQRTLRVT